MDIASGISMVKDLALTGSAITGAVVAVLGLSSWKKQIKGQTSYELTRRLTRNTYTLRNALLEAHQDLVRALNSQSVKDYISDKNFTATSVKYINFDKSKSSAVFLDNPLTEMETDLSHRPKLWI